MPHPEKWRETVDPFSLPYKSFELKKILGYPHAGNDVFHAEGVYHGKSVRVYIKAARQSGADIENEARILQQLDSPVFPKLIDGGFGETPFSVTLELCGERLSATVGDNAELASLSYMREYGRSLADIHAMNVQCAEPVKDRRFFHAPSEELLLRLGLSRLSRCFQNEPSNIKTCFCHGDFHYANLLWNEGHISAILDFELSGLGNRDFDIAWAVFRRPGQRFMKTEAELDEFLSGYAELGELDEYAVRFHMARCFAYFLEFSSADEEYCGFAHKWLDRFEKRFF